MTSESEQVLPGFIDRIVRVGDTIRRPVGAWTAATAALLQHYEHVGFDLAPRHLGYDETGRHVLSFMPSSTINERTVDPFAVGAAVRRLHDAGRGLVLPPGATWQGGRTDAREGEVYCHNDLGPWNILGTDGGVSGFIDFDTAAPKQPVWELADLAYRFGPLYSDDWLARFDWYPSVTSRARRIGLLLDGYGWPHQRRAELVAVLVPNLVAHVERLTARAANLSGRAERVNLEGAAVDSSARSWTADHVEALADVLRA